MEYGRNRKNLFGVPGSVVNDEAARSQSLLSIDSSLKYDGNYNGSRDLNSVLRSLFEDKEIKRSCENADTEKFLSQLFRHDVLRESLSLDIQASSDQPVPEPRLTTYEWHVSAHYVVFLEVAVGAALAVAAVLAVVAARDAEEISLSYATSEIRNPILSTCHCIAHEFGGKEFGSKVAELFLGFEKGTTKFIVKDGGELATC